MKIRIKLIIAAVIVSLLPMIIMYIIASTKYTDMICKSQIYDLQNINSDKAVYINEILTGLTTNLKTFTSDDIIRKLITDHENGNDISASPEIDYTRAEILHSMKQSPMIIDMVLFDISGEVICSTDRSAEGTVYELAEELKAYAGVNNGISKIYPPKTGHGNSFYVIRRIYSDTNKHVGFVCQQIDLSDISDVIQISGYSNYAQIMLIDSTGRYIFSSVSTPKPLENVAEFRGIAENLSEVIPYYGATSIKDTVTAEYDDYVVCGKVVNAGNWSVCSYYDTELAEEFLMKNFSSVTLILIILSAATIVLVVLICIRFTEPIKKILHSIKKLNYGDHNIRLNVKSNDEFGELSTEFNTMFDSILESEQRYRTVVSMLDNVVFEINLKTYKVYVSKNFNQKFSFRAKDDSLKESFLYNIKIHKDDNKKYREDLNAISSASGDKWEGEYRMKNIYGDFSWIRIKGRKFFDRNNAPAKIIGMLIDIDREKKSAMNLLQKANFDALTSLYNRASFLRVLDDEIHLSDSRRSLDALMFIDLDDFKHFNDEFGHKCGDEVLKFVADTIKEITFDRGFGGRLGGDEFVMCLTNLKLIEDSGKIAAEMISILNEGFISESTGEHFNIHCSIGISFFRENGDNSAALLEAADTAMYRIKKSGKSNYAYAGSEANSSGSLEDPFL